MTLAEQIAAHGTGRIYGVPGSGASLELIDGLERLGIGCWSTAFEGAAAIMAGTAGRLTGKAGIAVAIKGPGLANMLPGMAACRLEGWPMLAFAEAYGPGVPAAKAHKRLDQAALVSGIAKGRRWWDGRSLAALAAWAEAEAPAPVLVELAGEIADAPVPEAPTSTLRVAGAVDEALRPVVIAGTYAIRKGWSDRLNALRVPVFSTAAAKGVVDETRAHAAGVYTGVGLDLAPEKRLLPQADLVVGFGLRAGELLDAGCACPTVNVDELDGGSDADAVFAALAAKHWGVDETREAVAALDATMLGRPFGPAHVYRAVATTWRDARLVIDTGYFCIIAEHAWHAADAGLCLGSGSGRYMGIGLPQALAAADLDRTRPTVLATGDGGIGPFVAEARLAAEHRLPLVVLHLSDGGYGSVRSRAIRDRLTQAPLLRDASWRDVFAGFGWQTALAGDEDSVARALESWRADQPPLLLEVSFDPDDYQAMVEGIR